MKEGRTMTKREIDTIITNLTAAGYTEEEAREIVHIIIISL